MQPVVVQWIDADTMRPSGPPMSLSLMLGVALVGAFVGLLGGLFGKGGSAVATPLLALLGIPPIVALASPLPATVPSTLAASYVYWRERLVDWRGFGWGGGLGGPAAAGGAPPTRRVGGGPAWGAPAGGGAVAGGAGPP